ncbi:2-dehydropantoate 2-reductase [uncultured Ruegeria sp.]|uniref:2-dehydropantoate 2-reductase n=1 Tax=uncultured Ruegeria sp. TaxID=259304 RepID=UPI00261F76E9|nr:2-dehydropantoate 2-reductase [uncultured Ruegeria sp.]
MKIAVAGAGSIGCYCGALLASAGHDVTLLGRARVLEAIRAQGLTVTDFSGLRRTVPAAQLTLAENPLGLSGSDLVLVTVKSGATAEMATLIAVHAPAAAPVVSWQNGLGNARTLRASLPGRDVRAGMVPFNVVPTEQATFHRATSGEIVMESGPGSIGTQLNTSELPISESDQIEAVQWGKLVINLNNALNALSGLTLQNQLLDRNWRRLMADQMTEALRVLKRAEIDIVPATPAPAWVMPHILRLPTPVFSRIASKMLTIDPSARTSMAYDLMAGRATEIDDLQGEIIKLGHEQGIPTPINSRVSDLIHQARPEPFAVSQIIL